MNLLLWMALGAMAMAVVESTMIEKDHSSLRHRQLKCIKKGWYCAGDPENCCGKSICGDADVCCIPDGTKGCDDPSECCVPENGCIESMCGEATDDTTGGRNCGIHGEECTNTGDSNSCCGNQKYLCENVLGLTGERCCIPLGGKGCGGDSHCCGSLTGNYCSDESRCVDVNGEYPGDAPGGRKCGLKGDSCTSAADCCGNQKYACMGDICCIMDLLNGCDDNLDCCSGNCNTAASLCEPAP